MPGSAGPSIPELKRIKRCGDPACGWLFPDTSRNGSRFYKRKKGAT
jgi:predicted RNA-binding Zn ribbon-like protein